MRRLVGEPRYLPTIMADKTCALIAAYSVMAALVERDGKRGAFEIDEGKAAFRAALEARGVVVEGRVRSGEAPASSQRCASRSINARFPWALTES